MNLKSEDLNHFPLAAAPAAEFNKSIDAENKAGSRSCLRNTRARLVFPVTTGVMRQNTNEQGF